MVSDDDGEEEGASPIKDVEMADEIDIAVGALFVWSPPFLETEALHIGCVRDRLKEVVQGQRVLHVVHAQRR